MFLLLLQFDRRVLAQVQCCEHQGRVGYHQVLNCFQFEFPNLLLMKQNRLPLDFHNSPETGALMVR